MHANADPGAEPSAAIELVGRMLFAFLRGAAKLAARFEVPMDRFTELAQLAYFQERRRQAPRDLGQVARQLGVSLRTVGSLNKKLRGNFLAPEDEVEPLRQLTDLLLDGPQDRDALLQALDAIDPIRVQRSLAMLEQYGWLDVDGPDEGNPRYALKTRHRSFVSDDLDRRFDGLNHQLSILNASAQQRFLAGNDETARARSWFFAAREADVAPFIEHMVRELRHGAIDLEETALASGSYRRFGVTLAIAPVEVD